MDKERLTPGGAPFRFTLLLGGAAPLRPGASLPVPRQATGAARARVHTRCDSCTLNLLLLAVVLYFHAAHVGRLHTCGCREKAPEMAARWHPALRPA